MQKFAVLGLGHEVDPPLTTSKPKKGVKTKCLNIEIFYISILQFIIKIQKKITCQIKKQKI